MARNHRAGENIDQQDFCRHAHDEIAEADRTSVSLPVLRYAVQCRRIAGRVQNCKLRGAEPQAAVAIFHQHCAGRILALWVW
jgi:hypothetical protein